MSPFIFIIITAFSLHITAAANVPNSVHEIAYDDEVPESCRNQTYCTVKPADYPEKQFDDMFKDYKLIRLPQLVVEFTDRFGDSESNCDSEITFEPLYKVREKRDKPWRTVVQAPERDFVQRVRLESCSKPDAPCFGSFCTGANFIPTCKQVHNTWELLVAKEDGKTESIKVQLPVCCTCHAEQIPFKTS